MCSCRCKRLSVSKHLCKFEIEYECACEERLASALDKTRDHLQRAEAHYKEQKSHIQQEITDLGLHTLLRAFASKRETKIEESCQDDEVVTEQPQEHDMLESDDSLERNPQLIVRPFEFKWSSGFKEIRSLLDKHSGKSGEGDFEAWIIK